MLSEKEIVQYAYDRFGRVFDPISDDDEECWRWESIDAARFLNWVDESFTYRYNNEKSGYLIERRKPRRQNVWSEQNV